MALPRRLLLLLAVALMALMLTAGTALAAPGNNGRGAAQANPNAAFGIQTAVEQSGGGCDACQ